MSDTGKAVRWWAVPIWQRGFVMVVIWPIMAVGVVFFVVSLFMLFAPVEKD